MKTVILILICALLNFDFKAQKLKESDVPTQVKQAFSKNYPNNKVEEWEKENMNYEAEFEINNKEMSVSFDENGNIIETEIEIETKELPATIKDYLSKNEVGKKIKEASKITDNKGVITYEVDMNKTDYMFDESGAFLSKEVNSEKD